MTVYGIDIDNYSGSVQPINLSNSDFIDEAERQGLIWDIKEFEKEFNNGDMSSFNLYIRFI
jgi:hypothetical protein